MTGQQWLALLIPTVISLTVLIISLFATRKAATRNDVDDLRVKWQECERGREKLEEKLAIFEQQFGALKSEKSELMKELIRALTSVATKAPP